MSNRINIDPDSIVTNEILLLEKDFTINNIYKNVKDKLLEYFEGDQDKALQFIKDKIEALWDARILTYTGYSFYVSLKF